MTQHDNTNSGALFENDRKSHDRQPDMRGKINIGGVDHWLSGWWKSPRSGGPKFLSLSLGEEVQQQASAPAPRQSAPARQEAPARRAPPQRMPPPPSDGYDDMDPSIPF